MNELANGSNESAQNPIINNNNNNTNNPVPEFPVACTIAVPFETGNNFPFISGRICDISVSFFCDTGVAITTISLALFKRLSSLTNKTSTEFINLMSQSIRTISGESVPITGLALIPFKIG